MEILRTKRFLQQLMAKLNGRLMGTAKQNPMLMVIPMVIQMAKQNLLLMGLRLDFLMTMVIQKPKDFLMVKLNLLLMGLQKDLLMAKLNLLLMGLRLVIQMTMDFEKDL